MVSEEKTEERVTGRERRQGGVFFVGRYRKTGASFRMTNQNPDSADKDYPSLKPASAMICTRLGSHVTCCFRRRRGIQDPEKATTLALYSSPQSVHRMGWHYDPSDLFLFFVPFSFCPPGLNVALKRCRPLDRRLYSME